MSYIRNTRFESSSVCDIVIGDYELFSSAQRVVSVGSRQFVCGPLNPDTILPPLASPFGMGAMRLMDCHVSGWTGPSAKDVDGKLARECATAFLSLPLLRFRSADCLFLCFSFAKRFRSIQWSTARSPPRQTRPRVAAARRCVRASLCSIDRWATRQPTASLFSGATRLHLQESRCGRPLRSRACLSRQQLRCRPKVTAIVPSAALIHTHRSSNQVGAFRERSSKCRYQRATTTPLQPSRHASCLRAVLRTPSVTCPQRHTVSTRLSSFQLPPPGTSSSPAPGFIR